MVKTSGSYTLDLVNKSITFNNILLTKNSKKTWKYKIVTRSKLVLSDGTTQVTNTEIEQVIIPNSVTYVDGFKNCTNLKAITIPDG
jgi:hypothetical protein